ncbi:MAG: hypothetical protein K0S71_270 [Clostridia bacterium]|jgi:hypothetical protein|nr:hypothetical protein [Clostridia bacterium]
MRVIIQHEEERTRSLVRNLTPYAARIECLGSCYKIIDIPKKYLTHLSKVVQYIEPNFSIELGEDSTIDESILKNSERILVFIGTKILDKRIDAYYNMTTHTLEPVSKKEEGDEYTWINCYSHNNEIDAAEYISCIRYLRDFISHGDKPIIIYANIYVPSVLHRYRALTYKIINSYLERMNGILVAKSAKDKTCKYYMSSESYYEPYQNHIIYLEASLNEDFLKDLYLLHFTQNSSGSQKIKRCPRQSVPLYQDAFYQSISQEQEIYVLLNLGNFREPENYRSLGVDHIPLIGDYGMLYAKKSMFDDLSNELRSETAYPYYQPILSHPSCIKTTLTSSFSYQITSQELRYKGEGVYIGVITTDNVDYTNGVLRTKDGKSRIACIWEQTRANEGTFFLNEQINEALQSPDPGQIIELPTGESMSTMMLGIAGGDGEEPNYRGVATQAEFLVAKIKTAPEELQRLYGGMPNSSATTAADALIGVLQLVNFARNQDRPLVLCVPFNTNIDSHDGSLLFYEILGLIARRERVTIIVPAGEEADKMHHFSISGRGTTSDNAYVRVQRENRNVIGIIIQKFQDDVSVLLYPPQGVDSEPIDLKAEGVKSFNETRIYSNGYKISFVNGAPRILFRMQNPSIGTWRIEFRSNTEILSRIDLWISQQELNNSITLEPSNPFITIGSLGNIDNVMTVGAGDENTLIVLRSSGRGYSWDNRVKPQFLAHASNIIAPCSLDGWVSVTGTIPAASVMMGVAATVYSKCITEQIFPLPNTLVMSSIMMGMLKRFNEIEYPNPSQGYGIFSLQILNALLNKPFIL